MSDFIITTSGLDRHGGRILPSGVDTKAFQNNPVMLNGHWGEVIGRWENLMLSTDGTTMTATAVFDESDQQGAEIARKVSDGFISACSVGVRVLEWSEDPDLMLQGQRWETITKCELLEVSIVDIPANPEAVVIRRSMNNAQSKDIALTKNTKFQKGDILQLSYPVTMKEDKKVVIDAATKDTKEVQTKAAEQKDNTGIIDLVTKSLADAEKKNEALKGEFSTLQKSFDELQAKHTKQGEDFAKLQKSVDELTSVVAAMKGKPTPSAQKSADSGTGLDIKGDNSKGDKLKVTKSFVSDAIAKGLITKSDADKMLAQYQ